jgi:hypothetical protein
VAEGLTISFEIAETLLDVNNPGQLLDGMHWNLQCSTDLKVWSAVTCEVSTGNPENGKVPVQCQLTATDPVNCYFRVALDMATD